MTRYIFLTIVLGFCLAFSSAYAGSPNFTGYAGLADRDGDGYPAFVGTSTATSTGYSGPIDCDDEDKTVYPGGLPEGAGSSNYCDADGTIKALSVSATEFDRFMRGEYSKPPRPSFAQFVREYKLCEVGAAATPKTCEIIIAAGRFKITQGYKFADIYVNGSEVLRNSGQKADGREIVTVEQFEHYRGDSASASGGSYSGPSKKTRQDEAAEVAKPLVADEAKARAEADAAEAKARAEADAAEAKAREDVVGLLFEDIVNLETADGILGEKVDGLAEKVSAAQAHGPLFEVGAVGGGIFHRPLTESHGDEVRGSGIGGGGFEARVGVDGSGYGVLGFGQVFFGSDGHGTGPDIAYLAGAGVGLDAGSIEVGPWVGYLLIEDHANLLDVTVIEKGGLFGVEVQGDVIAGPARGDGFIRVGFGCGFYGTKELIVDGTVVVVSDYSPLALLQGGIRFGAGALLR